MTNKSLIELTNKWIELLQNSGEEAALQFYCENIVPPLMPVLREKFSKTYSRNPQYDGLISLLGFAPDTVILAYKFINPKKLVVLHTDATGHFLDVVHKYTEIPVASFFHESFFEEPNTDIYRALEAALKRFPKGAKIAIELTGGKKTMSGALAIASGMLDIDLLYIDYTEYMPEFRKPKPVSTYIHLVGNPLRLPVDLFSEIEIERAVNFFNVGKYDISRTLFEQAGQRMANPRVAEICADFSQFYLSWNTFAFRDAFDLSVSIFERMLHFHEQMSSVFRLDLDRLKTQMSTIKHLAEGSRIHLLWNFYFSAERYEKNHQNDIAALLYYRTVESVFENSLKDLVEEFDTEKPDYSLFGVNEDELVKGFISFRKKVFKKENSTESLPSPIAMFDALCLLGTLKHPIIDKINPNWVANIAKIRNLSVYAHGVRPIDVQSVADIRKLATDAIRAYVAIKQTEIDDTQRSKFEFIELVLQRKG